MVSSLLCRLLLPAAAAGQWFLPMRLLFVGWVSAAVGMSGVALASVDGGGARGLQAERVTSSEAVTLRQHFNYDQPRPEGGDRDRVGRLGGSGVSGVGVGGAVGDRAASSRQTTTLHQQARLRYNVGAGVAGQYIFNPCDGLWTAGDVCPKVLNCAVQEQMGTSETVFLHEESACKITGLPGWGYNPSVVAAPKWLRERAKWQLALSDKVAFVATSRVKASNKPVACMNPKVVDWANRRRANATASDLLLLDAKWKILFSMPIRGGHCEDNPESVQDARLFLAGGTEAGNESIFVTYMSYKGTQGANSKQTFGSDECEGHWVSSLRVPLGPRPRTLEAIVGTGARRLTAERNAGIVVSRKTRETMAELTNFVPSMSWRIPNGSMRFDAAPESFAESVHNSIHPVWVERLRRYLGVAHRHYFDNPRHLVHSDDKVHYAFGKLKTSDVPFEYGFSYRAIFFTLTEDLRLDRFSRELLLPALDSARAPRSANGAVQQFAEGIQFITSAVVNPDMGVTLFYGVNDCEAAKMRLSFDRLKEMLEFAHRPNGTRWQDRNLFVDETASNQPDHGQGHGQGAKGRILDQGLHHQVGPAPVSHNAGRVLLPQARRGTAP